MNFFKTFLFLLFLGLGPLKAGAGEGPVVVELFTSQGCSTCPPADALLQELAQRPDLIALALHVDYWDYIGWKDTLGSGAFSLRQKGYAKAIHARTIYTPQLMIAGRTPVGGAHREEIEALVAEQKSLADSARVDAVLGDDGIIRISASPLVRLQGPIVIELVRYLPNVTVDITRGENKGHRFNYANVVTSWQTLGTWSGRGDLKVEAPYSGDEHGVIVFQAANFGPILAAVRID